MLKCISRRKAFFWSKYSDYRLCVSVSIATVNKGEMFTAHLCHYGGNESHQEDPGERVGEHGNIIHYWGEQQSEFVVNMTSATQTEDIFKSSHTMC